MNGAIRFCVNCGKKGGMNGYGFRPTVDGNDTRLLCRWCENAKRRERRARIRSVRPPPASTHILDASSAPPINKIPCSSILAPAPFIHTTRIYVVTSDEHVPYHDERAIDAVCGALSDIRPHGLVRNGDFVDLSEISHWNADLAGKIEGKRLRNTFAPANVLLDRYHSAAGNRLEEEHYIDGNHCDWFRQWFERNGNFVFEGLQGLSLSEQLHFAERGIIEHGPYGALDASLRLGHLIITHGQWCNKYAAMKHLTEYGHSVLFGHTHSLQVITLPGWNSPRIAYNVGFLGNQIHDVFRFAKKPTPWVQSFSIVTVRRSGAFGVQPIVIYDGRCDVASIGYGKQSDSSHLRGGNPAV